jgi:predicted 2-oxoglutarate/Fe(II)-dependent dioxygenase YbiX
MAEDQQFEKKYLREEIPNSNKLLLPDYTLELPETNIIHTNKINNFQFQKKILDHSDDQYSGGGNDTHAVVSAILYLSTQGEDFLGGDLLIGIDKKVQPKKGDLLIFTGGPENLHEVTPVLKGERASLLVWCSDMPGQYKRNRIFSNEPTYI